MIKESSAHGHRTIFPAGLVAAIVFLTFVGIADAQNQKLQFGVIGDTSYSKVAEQEFDRLIAVLNRENLAFVVHVGDFEADPRPYERNRGTRSPCLAPTRTSRGLWRPSRNR